MLSMAAGRLDALTAHLQHPHTPWSEFARLDPVCRPASWADAGARLQANGQAFAGNYAALAAACAATVMLLHPADLALCAAVGLTTAAFHRTCRPSAEAAVVAAVAAAFVLFLLTDAGITLMTAATAGALACAAHAISRPAAHG